MPTEATPRVQAKFAVSTPDDVYEREADAIADQVIGMRAPTSLHVQRQTARPMVQRQEAERPRDQPSTFPAHQQPPEGQAKEDELKEKLKKVGVKGVSELVKFLWDQFSNSEEGKRVLAANERDWKPILKFFEDFAGTIIGKIALGGAAGGAAAGAFAGALSARDAPGADPDVSPSTGGPVPRAPKDEQLFGLELHWDFITTPTGLTLKTPWIDSPEIPFGSKAPAVAPPPALPVMFKSMPMTPRICTVTDPGGDQGEADSRSAFIFSWLQQNRQLAEKHHLKWLGASKLHAPPKFAPSVLKPLFKRDPGANGAVDPEVIGAGLRSPGQPLDRETRAFMEPRFGHDFSGVRVHSDAGAVQSARGVSALAYTVGKDIVFDSGRFSPQTSWGRQLLAHELTHVVQQSGAHANRSADGAASDAARPTMLTPAGLIQRA